MRTDRIVSGDFGGVYKPGLGVGVELAPMNEVIPSDIADEVQGVVDGIMAGTVNVVESFDK